MPASGLRHALGLEVEPPEIDWRTSVRRFWQETFEGPGGESFSV